jgi:hypothetical protein
MPGYGKYAVHRPADEASPEGFLSRGANPILERERNFDDLPPVPRAPVVWPGSSWGFASLHPRLYAAACSAGFQSGASTLESITRVIP